MHACSAWHACNDKNIYEVRIQTIKAVEQGIITRRVPTAVLNLQKQGPGGIAPCR